MSRPWVGMPARLIAEKQHFAQYRQYVDAVVAAGGLPVLIPPLGRRDIISEYANRLDGILLTGSPADVDPARYSRPAHPKLGPPDPLRDETDFVLLEIAEQRHRPVLAICFGCQSLNVYRGGTLIQDIPSLVENPQRHDQSGDPITAKAHDVEIASGSLVSRLAGTSSLRVNSYHHQSIETAGRDLRVVAVAPDRVVEAIEDTRGRFILGIQWHPERGWQDDEFSKALFREFVEACCSGAHSPQSR